MAVRFCMTAGAGAGHRTMIDIHTAPLRAGRMAVVTGVGGGDMAAGLCVTADTGAGDG